jgi:hypothetical protein
VLPKSHRKDGSLLSTVESGDLNRFDAQCARRRLPTVPQKQYGRDSTASHFRSGIFKNLSNRRELAIRCLGRRFDRFQHVCIVSINDLRFLADLFKTRLNRFQSFSTEACRRVPPPTASSVCILPLASVMTYRMASDLSLRSKTAIGRNSSRLMTITMASRRPMRILCQPIVRCLIRRG